MFGAVGRATPPAASASSARSSAWWPASSPAPSSASSPASSRRPVGSTRSSRRSCSTTSPRASPGGSSPGPLQAESSKTSGIPQTELIPEGAQVGAVAGIPIGFVIAVAARGRCAGGCCRAPPWASGSTPWAPTSTPPRYAGISISRIVTLSMILGGGLAGLAGALEAEGTLYRFEPAIGGTLGFDGITIALLARANPLATHPRGVPRRRPAHRGRRACSSRPASPRGRRPAPRDHPAHGLHPRARQVDLPQPGRQGHRRVDELGELT